MSQLKFLLLPIIALLGFLDYEMYYIIAKIKIKTLCISLCIPSIQFGHEKPMDFLPFPTNGWSALALLPRPVRWRHRTEGRISGSFTEAWPTPPCEVEGGEHGDGCRRDLDDGLTCAIGEKWRWRKTAYLTRCYKKKER
jgi:hypothetical protein